MCDATVRNSRTRGSEDEVDEFVATFLTRYHAMRNVQSYAKIGNEIASLSECIVNSWSDLNKNMKFEASIRNKWNKMSVNQRKKLLLEAWPNISQFRRPDIVVDFQRANGPSEIDDKTKSSMLWPYINQQSLTTDLVLPYFLSHRGGHTPNVFFFSDAVWPGFSVFHGRIPPSWTASTCSGHIIIQDPSTSNRYASLVSDSDINQRLETHCQKIPVSEGYLTLIVQKGIYEFLVKVCELLKPEPPPQGQTVPLPPINLQRLLSDESGLAELPHTPYSLPADFNVISLLACVEAKFSASESHIWDLREDPRYFAETLYAQENSKEKDMWSQTIRTVIAEAYTDLQTWSQLRRLLTDLQKCLERDKKQFQANNALNEELQLAFQKLITFLVPMCRCQVTRLITAISGDINSFGMKKFQSAFKRLCDERNWTISVLPSLIDALGHALQKEHSSNKSISPLAMRIISDLSIVTVCFREMNFFQPWAMELLTEMRSKSEEEKQELYQDWELIARSREIFETEIEGFDFSNLGKPDGGRFSCPTQNLVSERSVNKQRRAEKALDDFWNQKMNKRTEGNENNEMTLANLVFESLSIKRTLHRTPEWTETTYAENKSVSQNPTTGPLSQSDIDFELRFRTTATIGQEENNDNTRFRTKPKSRGATTPQVKAPVEVNDVCNAESKPKFTVKEETIEKLPGEIPWTAFLKMMKAAGFCKYNMFGSARNFFKGERTIQIHEPHGQHGRKLPFTMARSIGRRLTSNFGLNYESFMVGG
ncbi:hypothetical protein TSTA_110630 [Talaromyces stipitatus ATCC 10500]|uniref:Clr5 domain-containing protein n=1 Tax=Talaromyces stipitatus (strain ATCC 10500 / CBS 375.48 / QM 6759 / NRRL 1006) TaxID=441959 RepID=B8MUZ4_TALSN|nr:uncharacterized protein TSTA_110630 [Talaromyces stipitatus ATCC 10500]EED11884.1 hypothetical protein TSTA_110630 [Talaromyces stipitatus ATCC 10500]